MQALILAAGMGRRLGDLTKENTKCMLKVHGVSLIERMLTHLSKFELKRVIIVVGYKGQNVINLIGNNYKGLQIEYVENPIYETTNNIYSLALAKNYLLDDDTILIESDLIISFEILEELIHNEYPSLAVVSKYQSWMDGTVVTIDDQCHITSFVPKRHFNIRDIVRYYKTVNVYKFSKSFSRTHYVPFLEAYSSALGNNEYYEQVLRVISMLEKPEIKALITKHKWYEIDDVQDYDNAEVLFAPDVESLNLYQKRFGGYWRYPELLDFCYLVNPFFPNDKLKSELNANFNVLLTEYPSGQGVNSILASNVFNVDRNQIAVGNGAAELIKALFEVVKGTTGVVLPTFEEYPNRLDNNRVHYFYSEEPYFNYGISELKTWIESVDRLVLINPDNPSGNYIKSEDLIGFIDWCYRRKKQVVVDESFIDFSNEGSKATLFEKNLLCNYPNLIVIKSISKSYGVPGLRLGVVASGDEELINEIKKHLSIWNINSFGEFFLQIVDKYKNDYLNACDLFKIERNRFFAELNNIKYLRPIKSEANYFLCEIVNSISAQELTRLLLRDYNILIKDCSPKSGFNGRQYVRIAVRGKADNFRLIQVLKSLEI